MKLQHQLFDLGGDLATPADAKNAGKIRRIGEGHVGFLEREIDAATAELPALKRFILPGGNVTAARLHVARTVCRRAERRVINLQHSVDVPQLVVIYLNRLSDLLFSLARVANVRAGAGEVTW